MFRRSVVLIGILACELGLPCLLTDATAGPAVRELPVEEDSARGSVTDFPTADRFVTIAVPRADCGCSQSPSVTTASRVRTVRLIDYVALLPETREAVADEIIRFSDGRRIDVDGSVQADADTIYVLLRLGEAPAHSRSARKRAGRADDAPLAWTLFQQDQPASHIFVWVGAVQRLLDRSSIEGRPFTSWHAGLRRAFAGAGTRPRSGPRNRPPDMWTFACARGSYEMAIYYRRSAVEDDAAGRQRQASRLRGSRASLTRSGAGPGGALALSLDDTTKGYVSARRLTINRALGAPHQDASGAIQPMFTSSGQTTSAREQQ